MGYRGYGLPIAEVISEGNVGLMQAVKKFDPDKGFRLATYAMWWIRASIQEYILRSWSLVKMGTTAAQKKLFFNLRRMKSQMQALEEGDLHPDQVDTIATKLGVTNNDVISMENPEAGTMDPGSSPGTRLKRKRISVQADLPARSAEKRDCASATFRGTSQPGWAAEHRKPYTFEKITVPLVPPKPNELDRAVVISAFVVSVTMGRPSNSGSRLSILMDGAMKPSRIINRQ